jgi:predicted esterase
MTDEFIYRFEPPTGEGAPPLLLLHGTGGDENDLLELGTMVSPGSALLSPRGRVLENGMPRFFRRLAEGLFDEDDVRRRALELADFVEDARLRHSIRRPMALGYSNGANIAAAVMLLRPATLAQRNFTFDGAGRSFDQSVEAPPRREQPACSFREMLQAAPPSLWNIGSNTLVLATAGRPQRCS